MQGGSREPTGSFFCASELVQRMVFEIRRPVSWTSHNHPHNGGGWRSAIMITEIRHNKIVQDSYRMVFEIRHNMRPIPIACVLLGGWSVDGGFRLPRRPRT